MKRRFSEEMGYSVPVGRRPLRGVASRGGGLEVGGRSSSKRGEPRGCVRRSRRVVGVCGDLRD
jgi:hypothetical protein